MKQHGALYWTAILVAVWGVMILLNACTTAQQDRPETEPEQTRDATDITVWRNIDKVPNVATFCAAGRGWITTLHSDTGHRGEVQRFFEMDPTCSDGSETALDGLREG